MRLLRGAGDSGREVDREIGILRWRLMYKII